MDKYALYTWSEKILMSSYNAEPFCCNLLPYRVNTQGITRYNINIQATINKLYYNFIV